MSRLTLDFSRPSHRRRFFVIVIALLLFSGILFLGEQLLLNNLERNWTSTKTEKAQKLQQHILKSFADFQNKSVETVNKISQNRTVLKALDDSAKVTTLFRLLDSISREDQTIELFDASKRLLCWNGNEGIPTDSLWLKPNTHSYIIQGPIYTFLVVSKPVTNNSTIIGYIVSKKLFDVNYPISNRFINADVFASTFTSQLGAEVRFDFLQRSETMTDETTFALKGIDGTKLCTVLLPAGELDEEKENTLLLTQKIQGALWIFLWGTVAVGIFSLSILRQKKILRVLLLIAIIWFTRYLLVWLDFPSIVVRFNIFEPTAFASSFGFGVVKSIGDMFLTSIALLSTILLLVQHFFRTNTTNQNGNSRALFPWLFLVGFPFLAPLMLRGFTAVMRSAVFDSTLSYYNPMFILPPFPLGVMLVSLLLISLALVLASVTGLVGSFRFLRQRFQLLSNRTAWMATASLVIVGNVLFELLHPSPLFSLSERFMYLAGFLLCAIVLTSNKELSNKILSARSIVLILIVSIAALLYPLDEQLHDYDRSHVEFVSSGIVRPSDSYLTIVTLQALQELSHPDISTMFRETNPRLMKKLAFKAWAKSILSREGYNCSVTYVKNDGSLFSEFYLGADWSPPNIHPDSVAYSKPVRLEERSSGSRVVNIYEGYTPIRDENGFLEGGVAVQVSAGKQTLLGGETPEFLRNYQSQTDARTRRLIFSEYQGNELFSSTEETFPLGHVLPTELSRLSEYQTGIWIDEQLNGQQYETFYFKNTNSSDTGDWFALSMKKPDLNSHLFYLMRLLLFYLILSAGGLFVGGAILFLKRERLSVSFRAKLIAAFFVVALIPTAILAYYNRQYAIEQTEQSIVEQLKRETITIASALQRQWNIFTSFDLLTFNDQHAITVANDVQIDFTVFSGEYEAASSRPELFRAELFDRRMTSDAYSNIVLQQKNFYTNIQTIGTLPYIVGYRPLLTEAGTTFGIIAVPTLFRLQEIDEEIIQRNAYLFGAFLFAMVIAVVVGLMFSHQISSPVRRLHQATRKIGAGDFDVQIRSNRSDEFGELEQSFETMLHDLKHSQEEIIKTQRELAWKEMAKQVAHEIKNPLTPMKLSIQHLQQAYLDRVSDFDKLLQQVGGTILEQIETLSRIASEFSHFGRMPERKPELCDVHDLLRDVTNLYKEHSSVLFDLQFCPNSPIILADKEELRRAFMNIIKNSIQAMNERGTIAVSSNIAHSQVNIRIHDSGPGIAEAAREHLFEPNFSTKTDGMGLGLAIVKKTIDDFGGSIKLDSETGSGTTVIIQLPLYHYQPVRKND